LISPEQFAEGLLEDLKVPTDLIMPLTSMIAKSIRDQVTDYYHHAPIALIKGKDVFNDITSDAPEIRIRIKLEIVVNKIELSDEIEWDLNCKRNEPGISRWFSISRAVRGEFMCRTKPTKRVHVYIYF
jgi:hypothetical protein